MNIIFQSIHFQVRAVNLRGCIAKTVFRQPKLLAMLPNLCKLKDLDQYQKNHPQK